MSPATRVLWSFGVLGLLLCLSACGREVPAAVSIPQPTELEHVSTPVPSGQAPVTPTPVFTAGEPVTAPQVPEEEMVTNQPTSPSPPDPGLDPLVEQAKEDLAHRLSVPVDQIEVLEAVAVVWPDASLGCPQPGQTYAQVLTPGLRVILEAGGQVYEYHTGTMQPIVLCREEGSTMEDSLVPGTGEPGLETLVEQAREDLAVRLSVVPEQITILEAKAVVWPDSSLGCPQPGMAYAEVLTPGYLILLGANHEEYEYHASRGTEVIYCENPSPPIPGTPDDT